MKVRDLFVKDPLQSSLLNNGVAEVTTTLNEEQLKTLHYELDTFVCEGEYASGMSRILGSYLRSLNQPEQPAVWVSGFFGSGKSHFIKMLRYLWTDFQFDDGSTARGIVKLPIDITDNLKELSTRAKQFGGIHAAAGKMESGAGSVRLALLAIVFQSVGLPEQYSKARFVSRLKRTGIYQKVVDNVSNAGKEFRHELNHLFASNVLAEAMIKTDPTFAPSVADVKSVLKNEYPFRSDITTQEMTDAINEALADDRGKIPLTLIALDELQQYIGDDANRSIDVQQVTEACCKHFGSRLLFVGTGQTALSNTPSLQRLVDRFRIPIQLSDTDVETVIRKIVLQKRADKEKVISDVFKTYSGEIDRQLQETQIAKQTEDNQWYTTDYPLLPVRRRFWEKVLRAIDTAGTTGQLRTQLRIVHEAVRTTAEKELGTVLPGDFIYDQISNDLLMKGVLLREIHEVIIKHRDGTPDGELRSRICSLAFLIGKLSREVGSDIGLRATAHTLPDLLVDDLKAGSTDLRKKMPELLNSLVAKGHLMRVEEEYRMQTREGAAWEAEFRDNYSKVFNDPKRLASERTDLFKKAIGNQVRSVKINQGTSQTPRKVEVFFSSEKPTSTGQAIPVWVRDGWQDDEKAVLADARTAGTNSPMVFLFTPHRSADELKRIIATWKAAHDTLTTRGIPSSLEGAEARSAMETREKESERKLNELVDDIVAATKVYQAGGSEMTTGMFLAERVQEAADAALIRLYPNFGMGNNPNWPKVMERAKKGDGNALESIGYTGGVETHSLCALVLQEIGAGKKGREIRDKFEGSPHGWPKDTINAAVCVLVGAGLVRAVQNNKTLTVRDLDGQNIGVVDFRAETITISTLQRVQIRKVLQEAKVPCKPNEELVAMPNLIQALLELAKRASGEPPCPSRPSTLYIEEIAQKTGNEQLFAVYEAKDRLMVDIKEWSGKAMTISQRMSRWNVLTQLVAEAGGLSGVDDVKKQIAAIEDQRSLLAEPDHVPTLCERVAGELRRELTAQHKQYSDIYDAEMKALQQQESWGKLGEIKRQAILVKHGIANTPSIEVGTEDELLDSLEQIPLTAWGTMRDALRTRFGNALLEAIKELEPKAVRVQLPSVTIRNEQELDVWVDKTKMTIREKLKEGPVFI